MKIHGVDLIPDGDMVLQHQARTGKPFEAESVTAWLGSTTHGLALDVGAYTGLYALLAARNGARVMAFEPNPAVYDRLLQNVAANGYLDLTPVPLALSDRCGRAAMTVNAAVKLTSAGRLSEGSTVELVTMDSLELESVVAVKIDVEGHECAVLRGALQTLIRCSPLLITEALTQEAALEQAGILCPLGYVGRKADEWNIVWRK